MEKMKVVIPGMCILIAAVLLMGTASAETIDGRRVYVDNARLYFNAVPHTIQTGDDVINFNFISKQFSGDIDIGFGFDTSIIKPRSVDVYRNGDWRDVSSAFDRINHDYGGMTSWYFTQGVNINAGQQYDFRVNFEIASLGSGKYWVCAKPSSQTIAQAIANDNFLCLDPWFDIDYLYKNAVLGNASVTTDTTAFVPVNISINNYTQWIWGNFTVNQTYGPMGYIYWNDEVDKICVNREETENVTCFIDEGNGSSSGELDDDLVFFATLNETNPGDNSKYHFPLSSTTGTPTVSSDCVTGNCGEFARASSESYDYGDQTPWSGNLVTNEITIIAWANRNSLSASNNDVIFSKMDNQPREWIMYFIGTGGGNGVLAFEFSGDALNNCRAGSVAGGSSGTGRTDFYAGVDEWHMYALGSNTTHCWIWIDGVKQNVSEWALGGLVDTTRNMIVAGENRGQYMDGKVDNTMIYNRTLTDDEMMYLWNMSQQFYEVGPTELQPGVRIEFDNQSPADITATNLFLEQLNISYNITEINQTLDSAWLEMTVNSSLGESSIFINGTEEPMNFTIPYTDNISNTYYWRLSDNLAYPAIYNYPEFPMIQTPHDFTTLTNQNIGFKIRFYNVSDDVEFTFFEIMANSTGVTPLTFYYCNENYVSGNVGVSPFCEEFFNLEPTSTFAHVHTQNSKHQVIPMTIDLDDNTIEGIPVTALSYVIVQGTGWDVYYINEDTDSAEFTNNNGNAWSSTGDTIDAHIHQFRPDEVFNYFACANTTTSFTTCTEVRSDNLDITPLPPTSPTITNPTEGLYRNVINITYLEAESPSGQVIEFYNITLLYDNFTLAYIINNNNSLNLYYEWNTSEVEDGFYYIKVEATDNQSLTSFDVTGLLEFDNNVTIIIPDSTKYCISDTTLYVRTVETETRITGLVVETNTTIIERLFTCDNGCSNETLSNWGGPGCVEEPLLLWVTVLVVVILLVLLFKGINK